MVVVHARRLAARSHQPFSGAGIPVVVGAFLQATFAIGDGQGGVAGLAAGIALPHAVPADHRAVGIGPTAGAERTAAVAWRGRQDRPVGAHGRARAGRHQIVARAAVLVVAALCRGASVGVLRGQGRVAGLSRLERTVAAGGRTVGVAGSGRQDGTTPVTVLGDGQLFVPAFQPAARPNRQVAGAVEAVVAVRGRARASPPSGNGGIAELTRRRASRCRNGRRQHPATARRRPAGPIGPSGSPAVARTSFRVAAQL